MSSIYNEEYYKNYDVGIAKVDYEGSEYTKNFLKTVARMIVEKYHPKTILDAGCAMGYLVEALRDLGVEAYGVDISEYAIGKVREDMKPYCAVRSLLDPLPEHFPKRFDMVTTIEVIEHLEEEQGLQALKNLCNYADTILFSSSPDDFEEPTHVNVRPPEYWVSHFARNQFYNNAEISNDYLTPWTLFVSRTDDVNKVIETYERKVQTDKKKLNELQSILTQKSAEVERISQEHSQASAELSAVKENLFMTVEKHQDALKELSISIEKYEQLFAEFSVMRGLYEAIVGSFFWKATKPLRIILDGLKKIFNFGRYKHIIRVGIKSLKKDGIKVTFYKATHWLGMARSYESYRRTHQLSEKERERQKKTVFEKDITFSILVPLYNTPENFLREMIESVLEQTYAKWELCLADGSDMQHGYVEEVVQHYSKEDKRIKYKKLVQNKGISENTNECINMATGNYIGLFDHDDLLVPSALYEYMKVICKKNADFIYCDEDKFINRGEYFDPFFKPEFAIDNLRANNYVCHFTVFKTNLLEKIGLFRKEFDGSQDHDMILRLCEEAGCIIRVPKILYHWRISDESVASDPYAKPYTIQAGLNAVSEHLKRCGLEAKVDSSSAHPNIYRIQYEIKGSPFISIVIPNKDHMGDLSRCIRSIMDKSSYKNYEIIIVENNSTSPEIFTYYESLKKYPNIKVVTYETNGTFNYPAINNYGVSFTKGKHLLFLNNDIEVISENWLEEMLMFSQRSDVGAVGAKLYYPNNTIQHAGVILGLGGVAGHSHKYCSSSDPGYFGLCFKQQNLSAVTAACLMMKKSIFDEVGRFDEAFSVAFNDVDLCMRIRAKGYLICFTPYAELYHYESISRGYEDTPEKQKRFEGEINRFKKRWKEELLTGDPYYNPNLTLDKEDYSIDY